MTEGLLFFIVVMGSVPLLLLSLNGHFDVHVEILISCVSVPSAVERTSARITFSAVSSCFSVARVFALFQKHICVVVYGRYDKAFDGHVGSDTCPGNYWMLHYRFIF
jgi:hypothetical protein